MSETIHHEVYRCDLFEWLMFEQKRKATALLWKLHFTLHQVRWNLVNTLQTGAEAFDVLVSEGKKKHQSGNIRKKNDAILSTACKKWQKLSQWNVFDVSCNKRTHRRKEAADMHADNQRRMQGKWRFWDMRRCWGITTVKNLTLNICGLSCYGVVRSELPGSLSGTDFRRKNSLSRCMK